MLIWLICALALGQVPGVSQMEFVDQTGRLDSLAARRGEPALVMVVTGRRLRNLRGWEQRLRDRFGEMTVLRVADIPDDPPVDIEQVALKLRQRVPEGVSILIDIERRWARELELDTDRPNLLLFDAEGRLIAAHRGRATDALFAQVAADWSRLVTTQ